MDRRKALGAIGAAALSATALPAAEKKEPYGWYVKWNHEAKHEIECHCFIENKKDHWAWFLGVGLEFNKAKPFAVNHSPLASMPAEEYIELFVKYLAHEKATDIEVIPLYR